MDRDVACPNGTRTTTTEVVCTSKAFSVTRRLAAILLACLWLRDCRFRCRADRCLWEVDGSDPPVRGPNSGAGPSRACTPRPLRDSPPFVKRWGSVPDGVAPVLTYATVTL